MIRKDFEFSCTDAIFDEIPLCKKSGNEMAIRKVYVWHTDHQRGDDYFVQDTHSKMRLIIQKFAEEQRVKETGLFIWYDIEAENTDRELCFHMYLCLGICQETVCEKFKRACNFKASYKFVTKTRNVYAVMKRCEPDYYYERRLVCSYKKDDYEETLKEFPTKVLTQAALFLESKQGNNTKFQLHYNLEFTEHENDVYVYLVLDSIGFHGDLGNNIIEMKVE